MISETMHIIQVCGNFYQLSEEGIWTSEWKEDGWLKGDLIHLSWVSKASRSGYIIFLHFWTTLFYLVFFNRYFGKSIYNRKYHLQDTINDIQITYTNSSFDLKNTHGFFRKKKIIPEINGNHKRMINIKSILKSVQNV